MRLASGMVQSAGATSRTTTHSLAQSDDEKPVDSYDRDFNAPLSPVGGLPTTPTASRPPPNTPTSGGRATGATMFHMQLDSDGFAAESEPAISGHSFLWSPVSPLSASPITFGGIGWPNFAKAPLPSPTSLNHDTSVSLSLRESLAALQAPEDEDDSTYTYCPPSAPPQNSPRGTLPSTRHET